MNNIIICDERTPKGRNACFNNIASLLLPYTGNIVISKSIKEPPRRTPERDQDEDDNDDEDEDEDAECNVVDTHEFLMTLHRENIWCKIFTNDDIFGDELVNIMTIKGIYGGNFGRYTTFYEYDGCIGFTIRFRDLPRADYNFMVGPKSTQEIYVLLQHKCEPITKNSDFEKLVHDIQPVLYALHAGGFVHLDIIPANIVLCGDTYKLIDYGNMQSGSMFVDCENRGLTKIERMVKSGLKCRGGRRSRRHRNTHKLQRINNNKKRKTQYKKRK